MRSLLRVSRVTVGLGPILWTMLGRECKRREWWFDKTDVLASFSKERPER